MVLMIVVFNKGTLTNYDVVKGKVHLTLRQETSIKNITVKMEGIAKTVVRQNPHDDMNRRSRDSKHDHIEIHKVLYRTVSVFPPEEIKATSSSNQYTLPAGNYTYDFSFKVPLNTECVKGSAASTASGGMGKVNDFLGGTQLVVNGGGIDYARAASSHIDSVLPPSFSGLGDLASVKYFFKATVNRASMFKMNARNIDPFIFLPIDPSPTVQQNRLAFVRRELAVAVPSNNTLSEPTPQPKKKGFWGNISRAMGVQTPSRGKSSSFFLEARFPQDGGLTPMAELPIKLFVLLLIPPEHLGFDNLYMSDFSMTLYANTEAKAQTSTQNSNLQLKLDTDPVSSLTIPISRATPSKAKHSSGSQMWEIEIEPRLIKSVVIPDYVPPTFTTCNIRRSYALEITAGFKTSSALPLEYVSLLMDPVIKSGVNPQAPPPSKQQEAMPAPPQKYENEEDQEGLPSYDAVIAEGPQQSSYASAPPPPDDPALRRKFGQSKDYYENVDDGDN